MGSVKEVISVGVAVHKFATDPSIQSGAGVVYQGLKVGIKRFPGAAPVVVHALSGLEAVGAIGPGVWNPTERAERRSAERFEAWAIEQEQRTAYLRELNITRYQDDVCVDATSCSSFREVDAEDFPAGYFPQPE